MPHNRPMPVFDSSSGTGKRRMTPAKRPVRSNDMPPERHRILCVDDDEDTRQLITAMLRLSDLDAVAVSTAAEALRLMEGERFSLYVIDGQLPDKGGLNFCEEIRRVDKTTPVVFFTGKAYEEDREAGLRAGADAYVVKPDTDTLVPTVKRLLERARRADR